MSNPPGLKIAPFESEIAAIEAKGAVYSESDVTVDGNLITASGPDQAKQFGLEICNFLAG